MSQKFVAVEGAQGDNTPTLPPQDQSFQLDRRGRAQAKVRFPNGIGIAQAANGNVALSDAVFFGGGSFTTGAPLGILTVANYHWEITLSSGLSVAFDSDERPDLYFTISGDRTDTTRPGVRPDPINLQLFADNASRRVTGTVRVTPRNAVGGDLGPTQSKDFLVTAGFLPLFGPPKPTDTAGLQQLDNAKFIINNFGSDFTPLAQLTPNDQALLGGKTGNRDLFANGPVAYARFFPPGFNPDSGDRIIAETFAFLNGTGAASFQCQTAGVAVYQPAILFFIDGSDLDAALFHESVHVQDYLSIEKVSGIPGGFASVGQIMENYFLLVNGTPPGANLTAQSLLNAARRSANYVSEINAHSTTANLIRIGGDATYAMLRSELRGLVRNWNELLADLQGGVLADSTTLDAGRNPIQIQVATIRGALRAGIISYMRKVYADLPPVFDPIKDPVGVSVRPTDAPLSADATRLRRPIQE